MASTAAGALRVVAGGLSLPAGAVLLLVTPFGQVTAGVFAGLALVAGALVLLGWDRLGLSGRAVAVAALVAGPAGTVAGLAVSTTEMCCMFGYEEVRGWPYAWLSRGAVADSPAEAIRLAEAGGWGLAAPVRLVVDAVVWSYAGMALLAVIGWWRRTRRDRPGIPAHPA